MAKRRGLPKAIIKKYGVTKKAWSVFRAGKGPKAKPKGKKGGGGLVAKVRRRRPQFTLPLAVVGGLMAPPLRSFGTGTYGGRPAQIASNPVLGLTEGFSDWAAHYIGYVAHRNEWRWDYAAIGWGTLLLGISAHKVAGLLGVNRALGRAKVPMVRI